MFSSLLQTKLYIPPPRPDLIPRPRLIERLNGGLHRKLTLVSAPAGFGKTMLVSDWLRELDIPAAWISLDESDNDPVRFLTYFVAALQAIEARQKADTQRESVGQQVPVDLIGKGALNALQSPQPPPSEVVLTSLLNEIAALPDRFVLIFDDYHLIESQPIHNILTFLLDHLPPQMHLVIATREDPNLPLARYRGRGQLTELRATDLRFTASEAATFLNQVMGLNLSTEDAAALEARTEGWIAGLQLAALSMQGHQDVTGFIKSFTGSHHFILDYLIEEVLDKQSEGVQTFLLQTAILDRLTGALCDAVRFGYTETPSSSLGTTITGQEDGQATLEMLEHANLFIVPLDEERRWYRYHHLFADLLRQRLHQTQPKQLPTLHRRASEWYEQNGFIDEAIEHALRGEYFEWAATLIEDKFGDDYEQGDQVILRRWLAEMPAELVYSRPRLCILHAWNLFSFGQLDEAARRLQAAEKMLDPNTEQGLNSSLDKAQLSDTNRMELAGRVATIQSFLVSYSGDIPRTIQYARKALAYLPEQELVWRSGALIALGGAYASQGQMAAAHKARSDALKASQTSGNIYIVTIVNLSLAEVLRQQGELQQVVDICERQLKRADENGISGSALAGWLFGIWGEVLAELNHLDRAISQAKKGVKLAAQGIDVMHITSSNMYLVRVLFSGGDITGAENVIQSMEDSASKFDLPIRVVPQLSAWQVRIWLAQGKLETASQWARDRELHPDGELTYLHEMEYIAFARILIAQDQLDEATALLQRLIEAAEVGGRISSMIEILILQALAAQTGGDIAQAMAPLEQALTLAEPGGFIRIFVDEGPPMAHLLYEALTHGIAPAYVQQLLTAFPTDEATQPRPSKTKAPSTELIEPLSEREIEVLQLIAEGLTNREIANRLYLSPNTVKVHTRNIYGKLDAHHRTQAVAQAHRLGLLQGK